MFFVNQVKKNQDTVFLFIVIFRLPRKMKSSNKYISQGSSESLLRVSQHGFWRNSIGRKSMYHKHGLGRNSSYYLVKRQFLFTEIKFRQLLPPRNFKPVLSHFVMVAVQTLRAPWQLTTVYGARVGSLRVRTNGMCTCEASNAGLNFAKILENGGKSRKTIAFSGISRANPAIKLTSIDNQDPRYLVVLQSESLLHVSFQRYADFNSF